MKAILFKNWGLLRILRLVMGAWALAVGIQSHEWLLAVAGAVLALLAVLNRGCCFGGACMSPAPTAKKKETNSDEVVFEEIT